LDRYAIQKDRLKHKWEITVIRTSEKYAVYGNDAIASDDAVNRQAIKHVTNTGSDFVDGVISGFAWQGGSVSYSFPDSKNDYHYKGAPDHGFGEVGAKVKAAAEFILDTSYGNKANDGFAVEGFTNLHISRGTDTKASIRYGESSYQNPTSYAYYPATKEWGGDVWFGPSNHDNSNAVPGNYEFATVIHETGHALGLKHGHESSIGHPAIPHQWDSLEYSVMTYNSFVGDNATGYKNEQWGFPQTYMMADIAALQHMYGANFKVNGGQTTYMWKPNSGDTFVNGKVAIDPGGDNIFATIWDGGGHDTYDLHAYHSNLYLDLRPGAYSIFKDSQLADLDAFDGRGKHVARGNIFNALQYNGDKRSLIEDAVGGSGNDTMVGNQTGNKLVGGGGNDHIGGWQGNDVLVGGGGGDTFLFRKGWDHDKIQQLDSHDQIDLRKFHLNGFGDLLAHADNNGKDVNINFGGGDVLTIEHAHKGDLHAGDFLL
jgi:serralysin